MSVDRIRQEMGEAASQLADFVIWNRVLTGISKERRDKLEDDLRFLRHVVVNPRPLSFVLCGDETCSLVRVFEAIAPCQTFGEDTDIREDLGRGRWYRHPVMAGSLQLLDLRGVEEREPRRLALARRAPDVLLGVISSGSQDVDSLVDDLIETHREMEDEHLRSPPVIVAILRDSDQRDLHDFKTQQAIKTALQERGVDDRWLDIIFTAHQGRFARALASQLPDSARAQLARMGADERLRREVANGIIHAAASINATIATIPMPVADILPITTVQTVMIGAIGWVYGREPGPQTFAEFLGALGVSATAGLAFREVARALVQFIPVAGRVVSASIASGATWMLGQTAIKLYAR